MGSKHIKRRILNYEKPWIRQNPKPPKSRTLKGESFSNANYDEVLKLQHCQTCHAINYPPRELCRSCLSSDLLWRETAPEGMILSTSELHHSQWEFFKRKIEHAPWPIATVQLGGQVMFAHLALDTFAVAQQGASLAARIPTGTAVKIIAQSDSSYKSVLIAVAAGTDISSVNKRMKIVEQVGLRQANPL